MAQTAPSYVWHWPLPCPIVELVPRHKSWVFGPVTTNCTGPSVITRAEAECDPEKAKPCAVPKATRYSPFRTSPSAMVMVTGPCPTPVLTNVALIGPRFFAASLSGNVSTVPAHPAANAAMTMTSFFIASPALPGWCRVVRNVRARGSTPPVFPTRGILFREPPDKGGSVLGTSTCITEAYETRVMASYCTMLLTWRERLLLGAMGG